MLLYRKTNQNNPPNKAPNKMSDLSEANPLAITLFSEIIASEQRLRALISTALPKGMEVSHFIVLNYMAHQQDERSPVQLARIFQLSKGAMTNTLGKLEKYGWVHVRPDWEDARRKMVSISDAGLLAREEAINAVAPVFDAVIDGMTQDKVRAALPFLRLLRRVLDGV